MIEPVELPAVPRMPKLTDPVPPVASIKTPLPSAMEPEVTAAELFPTVKTADPPPVAIVLLFPMEIDALPEPALKLTDPPFVMMVSPVPREMLPPLAPALKFTASDLVLEDAIVMLLLTMMLPLGPALRVR